tara:strand:+ start:1877 stop:2098 length:222 start_codon:yes stop_codon:yes gene_type:complete
MSKPTKFSSRSGIDTLTDDLLDLYKCAVAGTMKRADVDTAANVAGKAINAFKANYEYKNLRKNRNIDPVNFGE